jgi:hypothetical protein
MGRFIIISSALHYYTFFFLFVVRGAHVHRFQSGRSRRFDGRQPLAHPAKNHLPLVIPALLSGFI